jgi:hypothetical protein
MRRAVARVTPIARASSESVSRGRRASNASMAASPLARVARKSLSSGLAKVLMADLRHACSESEHFQKHITEFSHGRKPPMAARRRACGLQNWR